MSRTTTDRRSDTAAGARRTPLLFFLEFFALLSASRAEVIGVHLGDDSEGGSPSPAAEADAGLANLFDPLLRLNRYTFHNTVLEQHPDEVPHWVVLFCPAWYEPCQALQPIYRKLAERWQDQLNGALLSTQVRFASVDCATEKALCNTQNAGMDYPFVAYYQQRQMKGQWRGKSFETDEARLSAFLQKRLGALAAAASSSLAEDGVTAEGAHGIPVDFLLVFAAIAGNAWFIGRGAVGSEASAASAKPCGAGPAPPVDPGTAGEATPGMPPGGERAACAARALPKEWSQERESLEL